MGINIFGVILSIMIVGIMLYTACLVFFNKKMNGYLRLFIVLIFMIAIVLFIKNDMIYFWS